MSDSPGNHIRSFTLRTDAKHGHNKYASLSSARPPAVPRMNTSPCSAFTADTPIGVNLFSAARFLRSSPLSQRVAQATAAGSVVGEVHSARLFKKHVDSVSEITDDDWQQVHEALAPLHRLAVHGPFPNRLAAARSTSRRRGVGEYRFALEVAKRIGAACVVVHFSPWRIGSHRARAVAVETLRELADSALHLGVRMAVENGGQCPGVRSFLSLLDELDHSNIGATLDTGHLTQLLTPGEQCTADAVRRYNELLLSLAAELTHRGKLFHVHLNDVHAGDFGDHYAPGTGVVDFPALFSLLQDSEYGGLLAIEMHRATRPETGSLSPGEFVAAVRYAQTCWRTAAVSRTKV